MPDDPIFGYVFTLFLMAALLWLVVYWGGGPPTGGANA